MKKLIALLLFALFTIFVWPTRYKHYEAGESPYAAQIGSDASVRVDRITGEIETQNASGQWLSVGNARKAVAFERPAVDPNATRRPSLEDNERVVNQQRRSIESTQEAVNKQIQK